MASLRPNQPERAKTSPKQKITVTKINSGMTMHQPKHQPIALSKKDRVFTVISPFSLTGPKSNLTLAYVKRINKKENRPPENLETAFSLPGTDQYSKELLDDPPDRPMPKGAVDNIGPRRNLGQGPKNNQTIDEEQHSEDFTKHLNRGFHGEPPTRRIEGAD